MNYSDKKVVADLTVLLESYGVRHVVACPGSRNAPIVHNLDVAGFVLTSVTDERSAGFVALGMTLALHAPVAVCVTSGSALLATLPAAAEAYYRHLPLLVVSADRPPYRLNQWDGQTLPQVNALQPYARCFNLEDNDDSYRLHHNRLCLNQALTLLTEQPGPVHINVQLEEPLFGFTQSELPGVERVRTYRPEIVPCLPEEILRLLSEAQLPLLVMGQYEDGMIPAVTRIYQRNQMLVLGDIISGQTGNRQRNILESLLARVKEWPLGDVKPDVVLHVGGNSVDKHLRLYLRRQPNVKVVRVALDDFADSFDHLHMVLRRRPDTALEALSKVLRPNANVRSARLKLDKLVGQVDGYLPEGLSDISVMYHVGRMLPPHNHIIHLANSTTLRNAAWFLRSDWYDIFANRGTNGIEGSLSTAIGHARATDSPVLLMIGDLSFFYDISALAISPLPPNLHIILCNNGGGQIFGRLPGLKQSPAFDAYICAGGEHHAEGIAAAFGIDYRCVDRPEVLEEAIRATLFPDKPHTTLLEVCTTDENNHDAWKSLLQTISILPR